MTIKKTENINITAVTAIGITVTVVTTFMFMLFNNIKTTEDPRFKQVFQETYTECVGIKHTTNDSCLQLARVAAYVAMDNK